MASYEKRIAPEEILIQKSAHYVPIHPDVYEYSDDYINPIIKQAIDSNDLSKLSPLMDEKYILAGVFLFPLLTTEYCNKLIEELQNAEKFYHKELTAANSMHRYGFVVNSIGFRPLIDKILTNVVVPMTKLLYSENQAAKCQTHHSFLVRYSEGEDVELKDHTDVADITLNICLGKTFTGSAVKFIGLKDSVVKKHTNSFNTATKEIYLDHQAGYAVLHLGDHTHGTMRLNSGQRWNLIVWCLSHEKLSKQL